VGVDNSNLILKFLKSTGESITFNWAPSEDSSVDGEVVGIKSSVYEVYPLVNLSGFPAVLTSKANFSSEESSDGSTFN